MVCDGSKILNDLLKKLDDGDDDGDGDSDDGNNGRLINERERESEREREKANWDSKIAAKRVGVVAPYYDNE